MVRFNTRAFVDAYATWICKFRYVVIAVWVLLAAGAAVFIMKFISNTSQEFAPPPGTQAADAEAALALDFPETHDLSYLNVFVKLSDALPQGSSITDNEAVKTFVLNVATQLREEFGGYVATLSTYYELMAVNMTEAANHLISPNKRGMAVPLALRANFVTKEAENFGVDMQNIVAAMQYQLAGNASAVCNGIPIFVKGIVETAQSELGTMDAIAIPLAMLIMSLTLKSLRMMLLPLITIGFTLAISFGAMYFISLGIDVSSTTPSLMMSMCIAMSIDYNLFILSRYKEELQKGVRDVNCVANVLRTAGHTILVSGLTLLFCLLGLVFFPLNMLQSFGIGCAFAITVALLVCLTFAPALLLAFPTFFQASVKPTNFPKWVPIRIVSFFNSGGYTHDDYLSSKDLSGAAGAPSNRQGFLDAAASPTNFTPRKDTLDPTVSDSLLGGSSLQRLSSRKLSEGSPEAQRLIAATVSSPDLTLPMPTSLEAQYFHRTQSMFYKLQFVLKFPANVIVFLFIVGCTLGLGYPILQFKTTDSFVSYLPRGAAVTDDFVSFVDSFGYGYTQPYHIMLSGRGGSAPVRGSVPNATSEAFFLYFQGFLKALVADTTVATTLTSQFLGLMNIGGEWTTYTQFSDCVFPLSATAPCNPNLYGFLLPPNGLLNPSGAMYTIYITSFDPMGNLGDPFYKNIMSLGTAYQASVARDPSMLLHNGTVTNVTQADIVAVANTYALYFAGVGPSSMDAIDTVYRLFPIIICVNGGAVLLVVGIAFRSVVMPIRSVISIASTQLFVFGMAVLTYQSPGILNWTGWGSVASFGAVSWTAPIVAFSVIVGVALDYDIFLLTRVVELVQEEGLTTNDAVLHALCSTGRIITSAGIIMAVAFFGLLLSGTQILNLLGFFMVTAVLFDTFIVRTLLVPSVMSLLGRWNWYPRRLEQTEATATM